MLNNCFTPIIAGLLLLFSQFAGAQEPRHDTIIGSVEFVGHKPNRIVIVCTGVVRGNQNLLGGSFDATGIAEFGEKSVYWVPSRADFYRTTEDELVTSGESYVFDVLIDPIKVIEVRPLRCAEKERAKEKLAKVYGHLYERHEPLTAIEREGLEAEFKRATPRFWSDHVEGASLHPRTQCLLDYLIAFDDKEKALRWGAEIIADKTLDARLRAAVVIALIRKTPEFALDERSTALIGELRKNANTAEDATALKALLDAICGAYVSKPARIPPVDEIILEALDPAKRSEEYRLAFAKRLRIVWRDPFRKPALEAMLSVLETESVGSPNRVNPGIPDAVGDWVLYRLTRGSRILEAKKLGLEKIDYTRLHPTVQARLDIPKLTEEERR